jgi:uncharacterized protein YjbI with pentapeptide repeats
MIDENNSFAEMLRQARTEDNYMEYQQFTNEKLQDFDVSRVEFKKVSFKSCHFTNCDFTKAGFYESTFEDCSFAGCIFIDTYWSNISVSECKHDGCNMSRSHFKMTTLLNSSFRYANFNNSVWEKVKIESCNFREAACHEVRMIKPIFKSVDFTGTDFFKTPLKGIDLSDCIIEGIAVSETCAELKGAKINTMQAVDVAQIIGVKIK